MSENRTRAGRHNRHSSARRRRVFVAEDILQRNKPVDRKQFTPKKSQSKKPRNTATKSMPTKKKVILPPIGDKVRIIPLGGVEEVGKNMTVIEYRDEIIIIDMGIQFTDENTPGIDYILPNTTYLEDKLDKIKAVVITHGHLDHIGGIPYLMNRIGNPPIYSREFGALLIKKKAEEFPDLPKLNIQIVKENNKKIPISKHISITLFGISHSIPDSNGVIIHTPLGDIVNTGDVRIENKDGIPVETEIEQYKIFKDREILLLTMDSTNIPRPGWSLSEDVVVKNIDDIVSKVSGRIIIATFASQVERIMAFIEMAHKYGKKIVFEGRSMKTNVEIVRQLGLVKLDHMIPINELEDYPPDQVMVVATGAQGEEFAALMRVANKTHKYIHLNSTDTVVLSSSIIPGNEVSVSKLKDNLYRHDAHIITYLDSDVHASGHGKRDELKWIHEQINYRFFMPVHGNHYMLKMHSEMAQSLGVPKDHIIVPDNGSVIEISEDGKTLSKLKEKVVTGDMTVDGFKIGDIQEVVIRDRKMLAEDGMFVIIASVHMRTGKLKKSPDIISRGFVYLRESQELLQQTRLIIKRAVESSTKNQNPINFDMAKEAVEKEVSKFLFQQTAKKPLVIPVVLGV